MSEKRIKENLVVEGQIQAEDAIVIVGDGEETDVVLKNVDGKLSTSEGTVATYGLFSGKLREKEMPDSIATPPLTEFLPGTYTTGDIVYRYIFDRECTIPVTTGSTDVHAKATEPADAEAVFNLTVNGGATAGVLTFEAEADTATLIVGTAIDISVGDVLELTAADSDSTLEGIAIQFPLTTTPLAVPELTDAILVEADNDPLVVDSVLTVTTNDWIVGSTFWSNNPDSWTTSWEVSPDGEGDWTTIPETGEVFSREDVDEGFPLIYTLTVSDLGKYFRLKAVASNDDGDSDIAYSDVAGPLLKFAPALALDEEDDPIAIPSFVGQDQHSTIAYGGTLVGHVGSWDNDPTLSPDSYTYQWRKSDNGSTSWTNISGATSKNITITDSALVSKYLQLRVTAVNTGGSTSSSSTSVKILPLVPVNTVAPAITGTVAVGQTLTLSNGTWNSAAQYGTNTLSKTWESSTDNINWYKIAGATSGTFTITETQVGKKIRGVVNALNVAAIAASPPLPAKSAQSADATSNVTITVPAVVKLIPANTVAPAITGTEEEGEDLTVSDGTWTNSPDTYTYIWRASADGVIGWTTISGETTDTLTLTEAEVGKYIRATVTGENEDGSSNINSNVVGPIDPL